MFVKLAQIALFSLLLALPAFAQDASNRSWNWGRREEPMPRNVRETREKMRIEQEKKEHDEMVRRAEDAMHVAERLERIVAANGRFSPNDIAYLESVEKTLKKVRSELGGDDNDAEIDDVLPPNSSHSLADVVGTLKATTETLYDQVKKTTRFSISAAAIQSSNAAIKIVRFLRRGN